MSYAKYLQGHAQISSTLLQISVRKIKSVLKTWKRKKSGFNFSLPDTPPVIAEDLIYSETLQGFVVSSKPFSCGRKQTHFQYAETCSQHEFFQNLSAMDTKQQTHFYQLWKKGQYLPHSVISMTDPVSHFCSDSFHFVMECQSWLSSSKTSLSLAAPDVERTTHPSPLQNILVLMLTKVS